MDDKEPVVEPVEKTLDEVVAQEVLPVIVWSKHENEARFLFETNAIMHPSDFSAHILLDAEGLQMAVDMLSTRLTEVIDEGMAAFASINLTKEPETD